MPSIADSLYNIQLLREFANEYLNKSFYLTTEDMLYSPLVLKVQKLTRKKIFALRLTFNLLVQVKSVFKSFFLNHVSLALCVA